MSNNKFLKVAIILVLIILLTACAPQPASNAGQEPDEATAIINIQNSVEADESSPAPEQPTEAAITTLLTAWMINNTGESNPIFGALVNVQSVEQVTVAGVEYVLVKASGIPSYATEMTESLIASLNSRPRASSDFVGGRTSASVGQTVSFGQDIGYNNRNCSLGYWAPGPECPSEQQHEAYFPLQPQPATQSVETNTGSTGLWVNGVSIFNWSDAMSYNSERVWENNAAAFELYDLDICPGHAAQGEYHHHFYPTCLGDQIGNNGSSHSPIYGFAADGYPIYGPWEADGLLAKSGWATRDYDDPASLTGCGAASQRTCLLVDQYDISKGTTPAASNGPRTNEKVTSMSRNSFVAVSGFFFQDYYFDRDCTDCLDEHNGHEHNGLGYHYHVTVALDGSGLFVPVFPYYFGPTYAGQIYDNAFITRGGPGGQGGGPPDDGPPDDGPTDGGPTDGGPTDGGPQGGGPPDLEAAATILGITRQELEAALGPPPPDFAAAAQALGITEQELRAALGVP